MATLRNIELDLSRFQTRVWVAAGLVSLGLCLILARAFYLQVMRHDVLQAQAEGNRIAIEPIPPRRGDIFDRHGLALARNDKAFVLEIVRSEVKDLSATLSALGRLIVLSESELKRFERRARDSHMQEPVQLRADLNQEELARISARLFELPGVRMRTRYVRHYPLGKVAGHTLGYIGRISSSDRDAMREWDDEVQANYRGTQEIGKRGVEYSYEQTLHGNTGFLRMETAADGTATRELERVSPAPGKVLTLTLDIKLQQLIEQLYGDRRGALVALEPNTGEVLAMVSMPNFDPNLFIDGIDVENWKRLNESIDRPLLNRAVNGTYPPGSTYKPFMALLALKSGARTATTVINDPGFWMLGKHRFRSHGDHGLGGVDLTQSIIKSSNVYYYSLAYELGVDAIHDFMAPFGFGQPTGIDLSGESLGVLPNKAWKAQTFGGRKGNWVPGDTPSLGIGQGYNNFTMLQLATATAALANGGQRITPHLVRLIDGQPVQVPAPQSLGIKPVDLQVVNRAMVGVTLQGTSRGAFADAPYRSAGKTGTAQAVTIAQSDKYDADKLAERKRDHSLYIAFAPAEKPQVALAIVVENAGFGSTSAAPIARRVFDYLLLGRYPSEADIRAVQKGEALTPIGPSTPIDSIVVTAQGALRLSDDATEPEAPVQK